MPTTRPPVGEHIGALDGLRGLAALWVFLSHVQILTGMRQLWVLSWGDSAVDLFMMISGFLMAHHYIGRADVEPWQASRTWVGFWLRRLFRIAPAYYLLLAAALVMGVWLGHCRTEIGVQFPWTLTRAERYTDHSLANVLTHVTFIFGALPDFAFDTPLPDWSIGLEMAFYLVMPFLMLALGGRFASWRAAALVAGALALEFACRGYAGRFEMPSFLPMKLPVFLVGMLAACRLRRKDDRLLALLMLVIVCWTLFWHRNHAGGTFAVMALAFVALVDGGTATRRSPAQRMLDRVRSALASPLGQWGGESAYSLYLVHLLVLLPVAAALCGVEGYLKLPGSARFLIAGGTALAISLGLSTAIHRWIEQPGISMGKAVVRRLRRRPSGGSTAVAALGAEEGLPSRL